MTNLYTKEEMKETWRRSENTGWVGSYHDEWYINNENEIIKFLDSIKFNTLVEIGCCWGHLLQNLANHYPNAEFTGVDISKQFIARAVSNINKLKNLEYIIDDAEEIDMSTTFDVVMANDILTNYPVNGARQIFDNMVKHSNKYIIIGRDFNPELADPFSLWFVKGYNCLSIHDFPKWYSEHNLKLTIIPLGGDQKPSKNGKINHSRLNCMFVGEKNDS